MLAILGTIVIGLIVGAVAKLIMPGHDPGGIVVTCVLGIVGAIVGAFLGRTMGLYQEGQAAGFLMSVAGAMLLLYGYRLVTRSRA